MTAKPHPARTDKSEEAPNEPAQAPALQQLQTTNGAAETPKKRRKLVNLSPKLAALNAVEELFAEHPKELHSAMLRHAAETFGQSEWDRTSEDNDPRDRG